METFYPIMNESGRILIPAAVREAMQLEPGTRLVMRFDDAGLHIRSPRQALAAIQAIFAKHKKPGISAVDEFIAERRKDAAKEQ